jgi:6-phospho-beta-glucosidase
MKVAVLGGAGVRVPLLVRGLVRRLPQLGVDQVALCDLDRPRQEIIGRFCAALAGEAFRVSWGAAPEEALAGASFVIAAIRVGQEAGRILDERVALERGYLGQETTGPGGFAFALRTVPVLVEYLRLVQRVAPGAWFVNLTNPVGLTTEALVRRGLTRVVGICDAPALLARELGEYLGRPVELEYAGLNHLGWTRGVREGEGERLGELLTRAGRLADACRSLRPFPGEFLQQLGLLPNEYLYYYYFRREALRALTGAADTRGEQVARINAALLEELAARLAAGDPAGARTAYTRAIEGRSASYMARETGTEPTGELPGRRLEEEGGYEGLALAVLEALQGGGRRRLVLNVPGSLAGLPPDRVVELPCQVDRDAVRPEAGGPLPEHARILVTAVKAYEELTVEAALAGDRRLAVEALLTHPLVGSYPGAHDLVEAYLAAHRAFLPRFHR